MNSSLPRYRQPNRLERLFNRIFSLLIGWGIAPRHAHLLEVRGRTSGRVHSTPVDLLDFGGKRFLVAPRGRTQWVRNCEAAGRATLRRAGARLEFELAAVRDEAKPEILAAYLDRFRREVQRFFPVPAGSPSAAFVALAASYPVFELQAIAAGAAASPPALAS
jgi:deazaflavin-dependent oxidoreductase (nitroreductase family)